MNSGGCAATGAPSWDYPDPWQYLPVENIMTGNTVPESISRGTLVSIVESLGLKADELFEVRLTPTTVHISVVVKDDDGNIKRLYGSDPIKRVVDIPVRDFVKAAV